MASSESAEPLWVDAPLHPPQGRLAPTPLPGSGGPDRPTRPPIYDPSHYGYGPWRRPDPADDIDLPDLHLEPEGWRRHRRTLAAAGLGAAIAVVLVMGLAALFDSNGTSTVETVFEFPETGEASQLAGEELNIQELLAAVQPSVVTINTDADTFRGIFEGAGSGVVIGDNGLVLTNAHVIQGADRIEVTFFDGTTKEATLVGSFPDDDIAIIRAENISGLIPAQLGSSADLRVGDDVVAIGNALDLGSTPSVTKGIVSAKGRRIESGTLTLEDLIQTDAAINPGNSGGPLVNAAGEVVGINTAIIDNAQNIGFAIAIDVIQPLIDRALSGDAELNPNTAFLGVTSISVSGLGEAVADQFGVTVTEGAFVQRTLDGSPAAGAGILRGDVITAIDGEPITTAEDVARTVRSMRPGESVEVTLEREGRTLILDIELDVRN